MEIRSGQRVRLTFEGLVVSAAHNGVSFFPESGSTLQPVTWTTRITPQVEILDEGPGEGAVGVVAATSSAPAFTAVYRFASSKYPQTGWYNHTGHWLAHHGSDYVRQVLHSDGTPVSPLTVPVPEPLPPLKTGAAGVFAPSEGASKTAVQFEAPSKGFGGGWYSHAGVKLASAGSKRVRVVLLADGTQVDCLASKWLSEPEKQQPAKPVYTPQVGDVARYRGLTDQWVTVVYCLPVGGQPNRPRWVTPAGAPQPVDHRLANFELVLRDGVLQEGVGVGD